MIYKSISLKRFKQSVLDWGVTQNLKETTVIYIGNNTIASDYNINTEEKLAKRNLLGLGYNYDTFKIEKIKNIIDDSDRVYIVGELSKLTDNKMIIDYIFENNLDTTKLVLLPKFNGRINFKHKTGGIYLGYVEEYFKKVTQDRNNDKEPYSVSNLIINLSKIQMAIYKGIYKVYCLDKDNMDSWTNLEAKYSEELGRENDRIHKKYGVMGYSNIRKAIKELIIPKEEGNRYKRLFLACKYGIGYNISIGVYKQDSLKILFYTNHSDEHIFSDNYYIIRLLGYALFNRYITNEDLADTLNRYEVSLDKLVDKEIRKDFLIKQIVYGKDIIDKNKESVAQMVATLIESITNSADKIAVHNIDTSCIDFLVSKQESLPEIIKTIRLTLDKLKLTNCIDTIGFGSMKACRYTPYSELSNRHTIGMTIEQLMGLDDIALDSLELDDYTDHGIRNYIYKLKGGE